MPNQSQRVDHNMKSTIINLTLLILLITGVGLTLPAWAKGKDVIGPLDVGPYEIGHTSMVITDPTRNRDGSVGSEGRPLYVEIWYPGKKEKSKKGKSKKHKSKKDKSKKETGGGFTQYSQNNPIYDGSRLPYYGKVIYTDWTSSQFGARDELDLAKGSFPLVIYSHGSNSWASSSPAHLELLASHGYIVASVEHTGNNSSDFSAYYLGLPQVNMGDATSILTGRSRDISFLIDEMLDATANPRFHDAIDADRIGLHGFSYGGGASMITVAGLASAGLLPDPRVKAVAPVDGLDYLGFSTADLANVSVPVLIFGSAGGQAPAVFSQLVNSQPKYYADIAGALHSPLGRNADYCKKTRAVLVDLELHQPIPPATAASVFWAPANLSSLTAGCDSSLFDGISDDAIEDFGLDPVAVHALESLMPLRPDVTAEELGRLTYWYIVSFFNKELKGDRNFDNYLKDSKRNQRLNPLVDFYVNCMFEPAKLLDIVAGDKITFIPNGTDYTVTFSSDNPLYEKGGNNLNLGDDDQTDLALGFALPIPGAEAIDVVSVNSNGGVTSLFGFAWSGTPSMMRFEMLLTGQLTFATLMTDLDPTAGGGVFAEVELDRAIITWDDVPVYTEAGNGATNTVQLVLNEDGTIEMLFGDMAGIGPEYSPEWIGQFGIASGKATASELQSGEVDFTSLTIPVSLPASAIFEQFTGESGVPCEND